MTAPRGVRLAVARAMKEHVNKSAACRDETHAGLSCCSCGEHALEDMGKHREEMIAQEATYAALMWAAGNVRRRAVTHESIDLGLARRNVAKVLTVWAIDQRGRS